MNQDDAAKFRELIAGVYAFYRQEFSPFALSVWWAAMKPYDYPAVHDALNRHAVNPDNGQFLPKPADVVKLLGGSNLDRATMAWTKVQKAIHHVGSYESVCFDDPIINAVLSEMGGWIANGQIMEDELPFKQREFEQRYRAYKTRGSVESYPSTLPGIFARENGIKGLPAPDPVLIGDGQRALLVYRGGGDASSVKFTLLARVLPEIERRDVGGELKKIGGEKT